MTRSVTIHHIISYLVGYTSNLQNTGANSCIFLFRDIRYPHKFIFLNNIAENDIWIFKCWRRNEDIKSI